MTGAVHVLISSSRTRTVSGARMRNCATGVGANGEGDIVEAAVADLREALRP